MADFEDSTLRQERTSSRAQSNLKGGVDGTLKFRSAEGKDYALGATRRLDGPPRAAGTCRRKHVLVDGKPIRLPARLRALFLPQRREADSEGSGPYFYLPKSRAIWEGALWNDVFNMAQDLLNILSRDDTRDLFDRDDPRRIRNDEIPSVDGSLRGLNCADGINIFSFIKKFRNKPEFVLPTARRSRWTARS